MLSPRFNHPDCVIDSVETLVAQHGLDALTIRALIDATGVSNGAIYRMFGSRGVLIGRMWIRAECRFLDLLKSLVAQEYSPFDAVLAAAKASIFFLQRYPTSAAVLFTVRRDEALNPMSAEIGEQVLALDQEVAEIMSRLAMALWNRSDAAAIDLIAACIFDLPRWIVLRNMRFATPMRGEYLAATVRAVVQVGPPPVARERELRSTGGVVHGSVIAFGHRRCRDRFAQTMQPTGDNASVDG